jgi:hypothetical protein
LENRICAFQLKRMDGDNVGFIIGFDKLCTTYPYFTRTGFDSMILHPSRPIGRSAEDIVELKWDRRGYVPHKPLMIRADKILQEHAVLLGVVSG